MDVTLDYITGPIDGKSSADLFVNADAANCLITSCVLKASGCGSAFSS